MALSPMERLDVSQILKVGIYNKTVSVSQGASNVAFTFDAIPNAIINAIIPISFGVSLTYTGMTGLITSSVDINQRSVSYRIFGTISEQNVTCKAIILYTLTS